MHENSKNLLKLMFREGESVCLSPNKYSYNAIPFERAFDDEILMVPTTTKVPISKVSSSEIKLVALNPIQGQRNDLNCTAYRSFLVEIDTGTLKEQLEYIKAIKMPYSACVFSGNKSLHFLITLDTDLPSESVYRTFAEWILGIVTLADQNCKNPSRSIRLPGQEREPGKMQRLVELKGKVKMEDLVAWLSTHPEAKPKKKEKREAPKDGFDPKRLRPWAQKMLNFGLDPTKGRNKQWFSMGCEFALAGFSEDDTLDILYDYFVEDHDFREREWRTAVKSGFKYIYDRNKL